MRDTMRFSVRFDGPGNNKGLNTFGVTLDVSPSQAMRR